MQLIETVITEEHIEITLANEDDLDEASEWLTFGVEMDEDKLTKSTVEAVQMEALRRAQDIIAKEIRRLSGH
jgi:hypothetical protein